MTRNFCSNPNTITTPYTSPRNTKTKKPPNNENETKDLRQSRLNKNKRVIVPKISNKNLIHFEIDQNTKFTTNKLGIKNPYLI